MRQFYQLHTQGFDMRMHSVGIRPANHPVRRLMAAAHYSFQTLELLNHSTLLTQFPANHWNTHISWKTKCVPTALVGQARANSIIRQSAFTLFGPDHTAKVYPSALARQGLIQVFLDYLITHRLDELRETGKGL